MSATTSSDGTTISFDKVGTGPAIITVGGAMAFRAIDPTAGELAEALAGDFTVVTYDRRGRGESSDTPPYAVEREIEDLAALIDEAGGTAFVAGSSSGAVLALEAARAGLSISKLALYEPPLIVDDTRPAVPTDFVTQLDALVAAGDRAGAVDYFMTKGVGLPEEALGPMHQDPSFLALESVAHTLAYEGRIVGDALFGDPSSLKKWSHVTAPTLVMTGELCDPWMHNAADTLATVLPHAHRETLPGQTHQVTAAALAPALRTWFSEGS